MQQAHDGNTARSRAGLPPSGLNLSSPPLRAFPPPSASNTSSPKTQGQSGQPPLPPLPLGPPAMRSLLPGGLSGTAGAVEGAPAGEGAASVAGAAQGQGHRSLVQLLESASKVQGGEGGGS